MALLGTLRFRTYRQVWGAWEPREAQELTKNLFRREISERLCDARTSPNHVDWPVQREDSMFSSDYLSVPDEVNPLGRMLAAPVFFPTKGLVPASTTALLHPCVNMGRKKTGRSSGPLCMIAGRGLILESYSPNPCLGIEGDGPLIMLSFYLRVLPLVNMWYTGGARQTPLVPVFSALPSETWTPQSLPGRWHRSLATRDV